MKLAVIRTGGKQYAVSPGQKIKIEKIAGQEGDQAVFDQILLVIDGQKAKIGQPLLNDNKVIGKILKQDKAKKVTILKYKSKKRYQVKRGHRQPYTLVEIKSIS